MDREEAALKASAATQDDEALSDLDLLVIIMQHGTKMLKIDHKTKCAVKTVSLDEDLLGFRYQPAAKNARIEIKSIKNVSLTPSVDNNNVQKCKFLPENCFTVECENGEPLVVVAREKRIAQCWVRGLLLLAGKKDNIANQDATQELSELDLLVMIMQRVTKMLKIDRKRKCTVKTVSLDEDLLGFRYRPTAKNQRIEVKSIKNVSLTPSVDNNNMQEHKFSPENCFTVECENREPVVVVATDIRIAQCWVRGLLILAEKKVAHDNSLSPRTKWLFETYDKYDKNNSGIMEFKELIQIVAALNLPITKDNLMQKFQNMNKDEHKEFNTEEEQDDKKPGLTKTEFAAFFESLSKRKDIEQEVMKDYSSNGKYLTSKELLGILKTVQGMDHATDADSERIIDSFELYEEWKSKKCLSIDGFSGYLFSKEGSLFNTDHDTIYQDMSQPLSHYFISSSHNTYLEGDQIQGQASTNAYVNALKLGCRCLELDCWNGDNEEPVIYHGHTLVNKILFKDVIEAINENAFVTSQYPLILSLENHCGIPAQKKMAGYIKDIFGDKLLTDDVDASLNALPSPEKLKNKILVKGKKLKSTDAGNGEAGVVSEEEEDDIDDCCVEGNGVENGIGKEGSEPEGMVSDQVNKKDPKDKNGDKKPAKKRKVIKLAPELSKLVNYCTAVHFLNFAKSIKEGKFYEMSSFGENKTKKFVKGKLEDFTEYNKKQLSRIYPAGSRIHSSNYNPQMAWSAGCQIVALNFQTEGTMMDLNLGKFRQNGNSGFILKPEHMRNGGTSKKLQAQVLRVKVISGQQFPKVSGNSKGEIIDPYVMVEVYNRAEAKQVFQTKVVNNNGFNPSWNETFEFNVQNPELALVRFSVYDHDVGVDDFICQFTVPFTSMRQGFRQITLNGHGTKSLFPASLFVYIKIN